MSTLKSVRTLAVIGLIVASGIAIGTFAQAQPSAGDGAGVCKVDPVHSSVIFKIKHLGTSNFYGRFNDPMGTFDLRDGGAVNVVMKVENVMSGNPKRDQHLKSPDFFSAKEFPEIAFKSSSVKKTGEHTYDVAGDLTLHGVTKPVTAAVEHTGDGKGMRGNAISGMEARLKIKRSDFGMKFMLNGLGDDVELIIALEGGR